MRGFYENLRGSSGRIQFKRITYDDDRKLMDDGFMFNNSV